jgi:hypothetical protein
MPAMTIMAMTLSSSLQLLMQSCVNGAMVPHRPTCIKSTVYVCTVGRDTVLDVLGETAALAK